MIKSKLSRSALLKKLNNIEKSFNDTTDRLYMAFFENNPERNSFTLRCYMGNAKGYKDTLVSEHDSEESAKIHFQHLQNVYGTTDDLLILIDDLEDDVLPEAINIGMRYVYERLSDEQLNEIAYGDCDWETTKKYFNDTGALMRFWRDK